MSELARAGRTEEMYDLLEALATLDLAEFPHQLRNRNRRFHTHASTLYLTYTKLLQKSTEFFGESPVKVETEDVRLLGKAIEDRRFLFR